MRINNYVSPCVCVLEEGNRYIQRAIIEGEMAHFYFSFWSDWQLVWLTIRSLVYYYTQQASCLKPIVIAFQSVIEPMFVCILMLREGYIDTVEANCWSETKTHRTMSFCKQVCLPKLLQLGLAWLNWFQFYSRLPNLAAYSKPAPSFLIYSCSEKSGDSSTWLDANYRRLATACLLALNVTLTLALSPLHFNYSSFSTLLNFLTPCY